ncbi:MAG: hypothetical protein M3004_07805 [Bacteroidota bacterium]|nr:hypothetical protein [Bacteroidota bacterium]
MKRLYLVLIAILIATITFTQTKKASFKPGQTFTDCKDCPEMIIIPPGSFIMGAKENEQ